MLSPKRRARRDEPGRAAMMLRRDAAAGVALALLAMALFAHLLRAFWLGDDPAILAHALDSQGWRAVHDAEHWRQLSPSNLTPWITLSFKADLALAGLSPMFFYAHQIAALVVLVLALYALMRQWLPPLWGLLSVVMVLAGAPTASVVESLSTRHYLEGAVFAVAALIAYVQAARRGSLRWAFAAAAAYALAVTAKEIYVPLVLLLAALPAPHRLRLLLPCVLVVMCYAVWRHIMLGSLVGGYSASATALSAQTLAQIGQAYARFPAFLFGAAWVVPSAVLVLAWIVWLSRRPAALPAAAVLCIGVLAPLAPLVQFPGLHGPDRYLFLVWIVVSLAGVAAIKTTVEAFVPAAKPAQATGVVICLAVMATAFVQTHAVGRQQAPTRHEVQAQGRFIVEAGATQGLVVSQALLASYWYAVSLCRIKLRLGEDCPALAIRGLPLRAPVERLVRYDRASSRLIDVSANLRAELSASESIDATRPLAAEIGLQDGVVRWRLGPYDSGSYFAVSPSLGRYPIARSGELKVAASQLQLHIQYDAADGWSTSSPALEVKSGHPVRWSRP